MHFSLHVILEASLENSFVRLTPSMIHVAVFVTLGQPWLVSIWSSRRGRLVTATRGLLLPRAALLLLPHATRWEALAAAAPLLLPRICRRWEASAAAAPLLLPHARRSLHRTTRWKCGWWLFLLLYAYRWLRLLQHAWWLLPL
jgi:hypothetical protein